MSIEIVDFRAFRAGASSADAAKNKVAFECANPSAQRSPIPPRALDEVATSVKAVNPDSDDLITQLAAVAHCGDNQRVKSRRVENSGLGVGAFLGVCVTALAALVFFARTPLSRLIAPSATHGHPATLVSVAKTPVKTDKILARTGPLSVEAKPKISRSDAGDHSGLVGNISLARKSPTAGGAQPAPVPMVNPSAVVAQPGHAAGDIKTVTPKAAQSFDPNHPPGALFSSGH